MTNHAELIARLRLYSQQGIQTDDARLAQRQAADALQAMERKPMTRAERRSAFLALDSPSSYDDFMTGLDTAEAFHGIKEEE